MAKILPFKNPAAKSLALCQHGHHKWVVVKNSYVDSRQGKLVTLFRCQRCGKQKVKAL